MLINILIIIIFYYIFRLIMYRYKIIMQAKKEIIKKYDDI
jgi:hypothetical protein